MMVMMMKMMVMTMMMLIAGTGADLGFYKGGCSIHLTGAPEVERRRQGRGQSIMFGGLEPRAWRTREREPITGVWRRSLQRGLGAEPLVRGSGGKAPLKLKTF